MRVGQARKRDLAEKPICQALERVGATVFPLSVKGGPDVLVCFRGQQFAGEIKSGPGVLTQAQIDAGAGRLWPVWRTVEDAFQTIGLSRYRRDGAYGE